MASDLISVSAEKYMDKTVDEVVREQTKLRQDREKKALIAWANTFLSKREFNVRALGEFDDGVLLINLLETAFEESVGKYSSRPKMPIQKLENVSIAFEFMKEKKGIKLISIDSHDIVNKKEKQIIIVLFLILSKHLFTSIGVKEVQEEDKGDEKSSLRKNLLEYLQREFAHVSSVRIQDFWESFRDGVSFCALVSSLVPGKIDMASLKPENGTENLNLAFTVAEEHLRIPRLLDPEDFAEGKKPDEKSVMNYLSMLLSVSQASAKQRDLEARMIAEKQEVAAKLEAERAAAAAKVEEERRQLEAKDAEVRKLQEAMESAAKQAADEQKKFHEAQIALAKEMELQRTKQEEEKRKYEAEQQELAEKIQQEKAKREAEKVAYEELSKNMQEVNSLVELEKAKTSALEADAKQLREAYDALQEEALKLKDAHLNLQEGTKKLRQNYVELQGEKDDLNRKHAELNQAMSTLRDQFLDAQKNIEDLRTSCEKSQAQVVDLSGQLSAALEEVNRLRKALAVALEELSQSREKERQAREEIDALQKKIKEMDEAHKKEVHSLNAELYRQHREHEEVLERIREEKRKVDRDEKMQNPSNLGTRRIKSMQEKIEATVREQRSDQDFINIMKNMEGYLLRRRPNANLHAQRFKKVFFKLIGTKLTYFTDHTATKKKDSFPLSDYLEASPTSNIPGHFTFKLVPKKDHEGKNIVFEFKGLESVSRDPRQSLLTQQAAMYFSGHPRRKPRGADPDREVKKWMYEFNRRIILDSYLKDVANKVQPGCKELLDLLCDDDKTTLVVEDKMLGVIPALQSLLKVLETRPLLTHIAFRNASVGEEIINIINDIIKVNDSVEVLELTDNLLNERCGAMLAEGLKVNQSVRVLMLDNNQLKDAGVKALADALPHHFWLKEIRLAGNAITDEGALALIAGLLASQKATNRVHRFPKIYLQYNLIGDNFAVALAELIVKNKTIKYIDLQHNLITDKGVEALAAAIGSGQTGVKTLLLAGNQISTKGALALEKMLEQTTGEFTLDLSENKLIHRTGVAAFVNNELPMDFVGFKMRRLGTEAGDDNKDGGDKDDADSDDDEAATGKGRGAGLAPGFSIDIDPASSAASAWANMKPGDVVSGGDEEDSDEDHAGHRKSESRLALPS